MIQIAIAIFPIPPVKSLYIGKSGKSPHGLEFHFIKEFIESLLDFVVLDGMIELVLDDISILPVHSVLNGKQLRDHLTVKPAMHTDRVDHDFKEEEGSLLTIASLNG